MTQDTRWTRRRAAAPGSWNRDRIVRAIRRWHQETGAPPRSYEWSPRTGRSLGLVAAEPTRWEREHPRWPERQTVRAHFGSWRAAIIEAGFPAPPPLSGRLTDRIDAARRLAAAGEPLPSIADHLGVHLNTARNYVRATPCRACGRYKVSATATVCIACFARENKRPIHSRAEVAEAFRSWERETGRAPARDEWIPTSNCSAKWRDEWPRWPSAYQVARLFGTWSAAVSDVGSPRVTG